VDLIDLNQDVYEAIEESGSAVREGKGGEESSYHLVGSAARQTETGRQRVNGTITT